MVAPTGNVDPVSAEQDDAGDAPRTLPLIGLFLRSPRRRPWTAVAALLTGVVATVAVAALFPRTYVVEARILAQKHSMIQMFANPHRPSSPEPEAPPTRAAGETILKRDSLVTIEREAHLDDRWVNERTPLGQIIDRVLHTSPPPVEEQSRAILGTLEKRLAVTTDDNTIKISVSWHQAETAYLIAAAALKSFLKDKSDQEAGAINESAAIIEQEATRQRELLATALSSVQKLRRVTVVDSAASSSSSPGAPMARVTIGGVTEVAQTSADVTALLAEKRREIQVLEDTRRRRLADLRVQLEDLRATLTPAHPSVLAMEEKIRQATAPPPELQALKQAEAEVLAQIKNAAPAAASPMAVPIGGASEGSTAARMVLAHGEDAELSTARAKLSVAVQRYEELMERLDATRMELLSEQAAFKYRYVVMVPPELPKQAAKPNLLMVIGIGALASFVLAFLAAGLRDLLSGRFVEIWQVQRKLPIPLIAEVDDP